MGHYVLLASGTVSLYPCAQASQATSQPQLLTVPPPHGSNTLWLYGRGPPPGTETGHPSLEHVASLRKWSHKPNKTLMTGARQLGQATDKAGSLCLLMRAIHSALCPLFIGPGVLGWQAVGGGQHPLGNGSRFEEWRKPMFWAAWVGRPAAGLSESRSRLSSLVHGYWSAPLLSAFLGQL